MKVKSKFHLAKEANKSLIKNSELVIKSDLKSLIDINFLLKNTLNLDLEKIITKSKEDNLEDDVASVQLIRKGLTLFLAAKKIGKLSRDIYTIIRTKHYE